MIFPSEPLNVVIWVAWGFLLTMAICLTSRRYNLIQATLISWFLGFVLMWIVTWNLNILPSAILIYAIPLSLLETLVGAYLCLKIHLELQQPESRS